MTNFDGPENLENLRNMLKESAVEAVKNATLRENTGPAITVERAKTLKSAFNKLLLSLQDPYRSELIRKQTELRSKIEATFANPRGNGFFEIFVSGSMPIEEEAKSEWRDFPGACSIEKFIVSSLGEYSRYLKQPSQES